MPELITMTNLRAWRARHAHETVVATNGCFDILHIGHLACLEEARRYGDRLIVGINNDAGVSALKGDRRPINTDADRAAMLLGLRCVDAVCVFEGTKATQFLDLARPNIYVKGGDYDPEKLDLGEREVLDHHGTTIYFCPTVEGFSTTRICQALGEATTG